MIEPDAFNGTATVKRPRRLGPAGDTDPNLDQTIATAVPVHYERTHRVQRDGKTGQDIVVSGLILLDPVLPSGAALPEIRERDYFIYTDATGRVTAPLTVIALSYVHIGAELDHVEVDV